ncbi:valine--tRNA ligase [Clostridium sp. 19966]|uniref:valine--tRNA ligase n=1 Tax=Clostridium sp. 19966 TaxID=2768166 RepID=UPI0028E07F5E|nr:valine--tRNA ligase [Clostridium sp. 19966]MDT8719280.1 valine--tRNA ligase [Clostridium sp. 19966]
MLNKKYDFKENEKKWQDYWQENHIYKFQEDEKRPVYSIDTPPPTVSGSLHIGHIFSYTQAEMIARFQRMQGKNVFYPFGFDDNGLPTERLVEKERGIRAADIDRKEFRKICLEIKEKYEEEFKGMWLRMGFSVDWKLQYSTVSDEVQKLSQKAFIELIKNKKAYIKESPVLWCTSCQTSIAQAELDSMEGDTSFNYVPFMVEGEKLMIATTRPELLYGCVCVFVNPKDERYSSFIGKEAVVPLYDFKVPVLGDEKADMDKGTGAVMCATFGDTTDVSWYEEHKLPYKRVIEANGRINAEVPFIAGMKVKAAREEIIRLLKEKGLLEKEERIKHSFSVHERCSTPVEIIPSKQWYIDILSYKKELLEAGNKINWYPESMKIRYINWVENLKWDWCVSRQRYFGVPIPVWYCKDCGEVILSEEEELPINPISDKTKNICKCGSHNLIGETAVLDTWATSSITPLINSRSGEGPMSMRTQAHEIIRTWAFYTIARSLFHKKDIPWKDIMICGFVMAKKGEKISKSKGNSKFSPDYLIENHSADALRYWVAGAKLGTDTMFSEEELKISKRFLTKLWNAASFSIMHLQDYQYEEPENIKYIDSWILEKLADTEAKAEKYLKQYEVGLALKEIDDFFWKDFCDNYLEIVKDRLYKPELHGAKERKSAQYALYHTLLGIIKLYAIYVPHITEEIYQDYFKAHEKAKSIHQLPWEEDKFRENLGLLEFGDRIKSIVADIRKYKTEKGMSMKDTLDKLDIHIEEKYKTFMEDTLSDIKACSWSDKIRIMQDNSTKIDIL